MSEGGRGKERGGRRVGREGWGEGERGREKGRGEKEEEEGRWRVEGEVRSSCHGLGWYGWNVILKCDIIVHFVPTAFFIRPFYKMMLNKPVAIDDMESVVSHIPSLVDSDCLQL